MVKVRRKKRMTMMRVKAPICSGWTKLGVSAAEVLGGGLTLVGVSGGTLVGLRTCPSAIAFESGTMERSEALSLKVEMMPRG